jgi:hypothetical protein
MIPSAPQARARKERTCYPHNRPNILGREHGLQDSSHRGELHDATYGCDHERGADVQVKHMRDRGAEYDKGETYADVRPFEVRGWIIRQRVHGLPLTFSLSSVEK